MQHDAVPADSRLARQLQGWRLTTAEILYCLPDHPAVLQSFIWQDLDLAPDYPALHRFLNFWHREIEGKLHSVRLGAAGLVTPGYWRHVSELRHLH